MKIQVEVGLRDLLLGCTLGGVAAVSYWAGVQGARKSCSTTASAGSGARESGCKQQPAKLTQSPAGAGVGDTDMPSRRSPPPAATSAAPPSTPGSSGSMPRSPGRRRSSPAGVCATTPPPPSPLDQLAVDTDQGLVEPLMLGMAQRIRSHSVDSSPIVIGVAGGTGSGKTTLARAILEELGEENVTYLCHDSYYRDLSHLPEDARLKTNFDHPDSLDTDLLLQHLEAIKAGVPTAVPLYSFATHSRCGWTEALQPRKVILVEGILIYTHQMLSSQIDVKLFVDTEPDIRLIRRISRDIEERGRSFASVVNQYLGTVRPMHNKFVEPSKLHADVIIPMGLNRVALDLIISRLHNEITRAAETTGEIAPNARHYVKRGPSGDVVPFLSPSYPRRPGAASAGASDEAETETETEAETRPRSPTSLEVMALMSGGGGGSRDDGGDIGGGGGDKSLVSADLPASR